MNNIRTEFSIKDLENLTGIKAHTIRIWEKRYNLLEPMRSDTNIRSYNVESLQKLLNVTFLNNNGYKISKISNLKENEIPVLVREIASRGNQKHHAINAFKLSMMNFDQTLFYNTYSNLLENNSFRDIFYEVFLGLLEEIGILWQTDTISPAHEHFITTLIKQKILVNIEKVQNLEPMKSKQTYVLFLPDHEIHDIGLLFLNYEIVCKGYHCIFLGQSVPINCLQDLIDKYQDINFMSYFTVKPEINEVHDYLNEFYDTLLKGTKNKLTILGQRTRQLDKNNVPDNIEIYPSIDSLVKDF
ncbi:MAG: MerR family transcriptional regulator [Flavobacteriaceae bacterium]|nr:MerR family transcriptional regulator [Flavobacteriaceae bacterium]NNL79848.1 MerR family transcriptional regulator [Flavobacteriaceae bacterium]